MQSLCAPLFSLRSQRHNNINMWWYAQSIANQGGWGVWFLLRSITQMVAQLVAQLVKNLPVSQEVRVWSLGWEVPLEKWMAIHSSILVWRIPWTEKWGGLQSVRSQTVRHDWAPNTVHSPHYINVIDQLPTCSVSRFLILGNPKPLLWVLWLVILVWPAPS